MSSRSSTVSSSTDDSVEHLTVSERIDIILGFLLISSLLAGIITFILYRVDIVSYKTFTGTVILVLVMLMMSLIRTMTRYFDDHSIPATITLFILLCAIIGFLGYQLEVITHL